MFVNLPLFYIFSSLLIDVLIIQAKSVREFEGVYIIDRDAGLADGSGEGVGLTTEGVTGDDVTVSATIVEGNITVGEYIVVFEPNSAFNTVMSLGEDLYRWRSFENDSLEGAYLAYCTGTYDTSSQRLGCPGIIFTTNQSFLIVHVDLDKYSVIEKLLLSEPYVKELVASNIVKLMADKGCASTETVFVDTDNNIQFMWGLDSFDNNEVENAYIYDSSNGSNVTVYIVDTSIQISHSEFNESREMVENIQIESMCNDLSKILNDTVDNCLNPGTYGDHGTRVASVIAGKHIGVARKARVVSINAFNDKDMSTVGATAAAVNWILNFAKSRESEQNVLLLPFSFIRQFQSESLLFDALVRNASEMSMPVVVAAGNSDISMNSCQLLPANLNSTLTVGATQFKLNNSEMNKPNSKNCVLYKREDSSVGPCVDLYAPGIGLPSADGNSGGLSSVSGTSFAAAHLAGLLALQMSSSSGGLNVDELRSRLLSDAIDQTEQEFAQFKEDVPAFADYPLGDYINILGQFIVAQAPKCP